MGAVMIRKVVFFADILFEIVKLKTPFEVLDQLVISFSAACLWRAKNFIPDLVIDSPADFSVMWRVPE